jgi:hypothetical protein
MQTYKYKLEHVFLCALNYLVIKHSSGILMNQQIFSFVLNSLTLTSDGKFQWTVFYKSLKLNMYILPCTNSQLWNISNMLMSNIYRSFKILEVNQNLFSCKIRTSFDTSFQHIWCRRQKRERLILVFGFVFIQTIGSIQNWVQCQICVNCLGPWMTHVGS